MKHHLQTAQGFTTVDFMFSLVMAWGFLVVFLALTLTFSVFEVAQYIAFSTARSYLGGHIDLASQQQMAEQKYKQLISSRAILPFFANNLFQISRTEKFDFNEEYGASEDMYRTFHGVQLVVNALILDKRLLLLGSTAGKSGSFSVNVNAFMGREVTERECIQNFNNKRFENLLRLTDAGAGAVYGKPQVLPSAYAVVTDNGC